MRRIGEYIDRSRDFMREVQVEMTRSAWPTRSELIQSTSVVIAFVLLLSAYVGLSDWILLNVVRFLVGQ